jgi:hypothetical protein
MECRVQTHQNSKLYELFREGDDDEELAFIISSSGKDVCVDPWIPTSRFGSQRDFLLGDKREIVAWQGLFQSLMSGDDAFEEAELLEVQNRISLGERVGTISPRKYPRFEVDLIESPESSLCTLAPIPLGSDMAEIGEIVASSWSSIQDNFSILATAEFDGRDLLTTACRQFGKDFDAIESKTAESAMVLGQRPERAGTQSAWASMTGLRDSLDPLLEGWGGMADIDKRLADLALQFEAVALSDTESRSTLAADSSLMSSLSVLVVFYKKYSSSPTAQETYSTSAYPLSPGARLRLCSHILVSWVVLETLFPFQVKAPAKSLGLEPE